MRRSNAMPDASEPRANSAAQSFSRFLLLIDAGEFHERLSVELQHMVDGRRDHLRDTQERTCKGTFDLKFTITIDDRDTVNVVPKVKIGLPQPPTRPAVLWIGQGGALTPENPRQQQLPFTQLNRPRGE